eukprot:scaffold22153_cov41-Prasinocladus_malaysianus.AAC.1
MVVALNDPTGGQQQGADDQLLDSVGIRAWSVEDGDSELGHAVHWDVVHAGATAGDAADCLGHLALLQLVGAKHDGHLSALEVGTVA